MISHKHQFIFIHIPKTGGSSIEKALWDSSCDWVSDQWDERVSHTALNHLTLQEMIDYELIDVETACAYFKFCFVRNPWDRAVSEVCYLSQIFRGDEISEKLEYLLKLEKYGNHIRPQLDFIENEHGIEVDFVGRFEHLQKDFNWISTILGLPQKMLPHIAKTDHQSYKDYYSDVLRQQMTDKYQQDILRFGYQF